MLQSAKNKLYNLLRWSEKYTKTDMLYLTKGGFWLVFGHAIIIASGIIVAVAFANLLPKNTYGTYQFVMSIAAILSGFTLSGLSIAMTRAIAQGRSGVLKYGFQTQIKWSSLIVFASAAMAIYYFVNGNNTLAASFLIVGALAPFVEGFGLYKTYLKGKKLFKEHTLLGFIHRPIPVIAMLTALLLTDNPVILVLVYFASNALAAGLLYFIVINKYKEIPEKDSDMVTYSKHLSVMSMVGRIANNIDNVLVFHFIGAAGLATYVLALMPTTQVQNIFNLGRDLIFPKFARQDFDTIKKTIAYKSFIMFLLCAAAALSYIILAPYIFKILFPAYPEAVILSQILMLTLLLKPVMLHNQAFEAHGKKTAQYIVSISIPIIKLALLVILLPLYGLWGAVWALVIMRIVNVAITLILFYTTKDDKKEKELDANGSFDVE